MNNKKLTIAITGGAGFIGSHVTDYLLEEYKNEIDEIRILDNFIRGSRENLREALKSNKIRIIEADIRDKEAVDKLIKGTDYVIHEAAIRITLCAEDPRLCNEVLVDGTFNVFESCVKHGVKKLVFNSSASVYGQPKKLPMKETDLYNNETAYGAAKIANEQMAKAFRSMYGLNYVALRPFNVYGPRMDVHGAYTEVLIRWLERIDQGLPPIIYGDGANTLDMVYVEDVAKATMCALKSSINEGFYNVGSGKETSLKQLAYLLLELTNNSFEPIYKAGNLKTNYATRRRASTLESKEKLGFIAETDLKKGLKKLIEWRREVLKEK